MEYRDHKKSEPCLITASAMCIVFGLVKLIGAPELPTGWFFFLAGVFFILGIFQDCPKHPAKSHEHKEDR